MGDNMNDNNAVILKDIFEQPEEPCGNLEKEQGNNENVEFNPDLFIKLSTDNVYGCELNKNEFQNGINDVSYVCGAISALISIGVDPNKAMDYVVDKESTGVLMAHTERVANIQAEAAINSSKYEAMNVAKTVL